MRTPLAILILGTALSLSAQDVRFGVQGAVSIPAADLSDNAFLGLQVGGHARWAFRGGHGLMARADLNFYSSNHSTTVTGYSGGADYTYHFDRRQTGPYVLAGLTEAAYHTSYPNHSRNDTTLGVDLGAGYDLDRHLGVQGRFVTHSFSGLTYSAVNLGVTYTF